MDVAGRVAVITGGGTGIGAASALALARRGMRVVVNYSRSADDAEATAEACRKEGADARAFQADVTDDAQCRSLAAFAMDAWGRIDVLVNNAGKTKFARHDDLEALSGDDFLDVYRLNVVGAFQATRACVPHLRAAEDFGSVVNISSVAGVLGIGSSLAYIASKGGLTMLTKSLARALAPKVRVNAVCPGFVATRWFSNPFGEEGLKNLIEGQERTMPLQQAGTPELIADAVEYFATQGARHTTGETLLVDAGMHLGAQVNLSSKK